MHNDKLCATNSTKKTGDNDEQSNNTDSNKKSTDTKPLKGDAADKAAYLGYKKVHGQKSHGQPVYKKGRKYITSDVDSHNGGVRKMADSVKKLQNKSSRMGTFDAK